MDTILKRGIVTVAYGTRAETNVRLCIEYARRFNPTLPIAFIGDAAIADVQRITFSAGQDGLERARLAKLMLLQLTPFDQTLYLDADTLPLGDVMAGFQMLDNGWDVALCMSRAQGKDCLWHIAENEREETFEALALHPLQYQCGVIWVQRNAETQALWQEWLKAWNDYRAHDQAAFLRALWQHPVKLTLLDTVFNGGAVIAHRHGA